MLLMSRSSDQLPHASTVQNSKRTIVLQVTKSVRCSLTDVATTVLHCEDGNLHTIHCPVFVPSINLRIIPNSIGLIRPEHLLKHILAKVRQPWIYFVWRMICIF